MSEETNNRRESLLFIDKTMVTVSQEAAEKIVELRRQDGLTENFSVRVAVKGGGCSGLMYDLNFASEPQAGDMIFEDKGVTVMIDKKSILYLAGTELQYSGGLNGKGFVFHNPNASRTCGCGESFAV